MPTINGHEKPLPLSMVQPMMAGAMTGHSASTPQSAPPITSANAIKFMLIKQNSFSSRQEYQHHQNKFVFKKRGRPPSTPPFGSLTKKVAMSKSLSFLPRQLNCGVPSTSNFHSWIESLRQWQTQLSQSLNGIDQKPGNDLEQNSCLTASQPTNNNNNSSTQDSNAVHQSPLNQPQPVSTTTNDYPYEPKESMINLDAMSSIGSESKSRDSYKDRRKNYRREKKKVAEEMMSALTDPTVVILADWLKVRGTLKGWTKLWCELKPGLLLLFRSNKTHKSGQWVGTVLLNVCEVIERPSKKNGFCFKLFHPLEHPLWAPKGPHGESFGSIMLPLPMSYVIFRAPSEFAGKTWMEGISCAIELSFGYNSSLLTRNSSVRESRHSVAGDSIKAGDSSVKAAALSTHSKTLLNESEIEKHFNEHDLDDEVHTDHNSQERSDSDSDDHRHLNGHSSDASDDSRIEETQYSLDGKTEEFGLTGDAGQTEDVADENKSLIWTILKQVRPGMDLSKVVLPTFILEPRSFLDKLTDYYYHCDILSSAVLEDDPLNRMKLIVKWYLSGFYKKPKGLKKPYNPILGETFRCYWSHPETNSRTFYIAEQVSHHPPISAFYVTNRQDGFCISGAILAKSKFYGNSISAILEGTGRLSLLTRGEDYLVTMPYAHCKGIFMGTLGLELGGKVEIACEKTGYRTEMEFKLKPFLGSSDQCNLVVGKIRLGNETLATLEGHWDSEIYIKNKRTSEKSLFWSPSSEIRAKRLKRFTVPMQNQGDFESEKLWRFVTKAINECDQVAATEQKTILEEEQRRAAKERLNKVESWLPKHFLQDVLNGDWIYKYADRRPWDTRTDVLQYEHNYVVQTKTRHKAPPVVVTSTNVNAEEILRRVGSIERTSSISLNPNGNSSTYLKRFQRTTSCASEESSSVVDFHDSTESEGKSKKNIEDKLKRLLVPVQSTQQETLTTLNNLQQNLDSVVERQNQMHQYLMSRRNRNANDNRLSDVTLILVMVVTQVLLNWVFKNWY